MIKLFSLKKIVEGNIPYIAFSVYKSYDLLRKKEQEENHQKVCALLKEKSIPFRTLDLGYLYNFKEKKKLIMNEKICIVPLEYLPLIENISTEFGVRSLFIRDKNLNPVILSYHGKKQHSFSILKENSLASKSENFVLLLEKYIKSNQKYSASIQYIVEKKGSVYKTTVLKNPTRLKYVLIGKDPLVETLGIISAQNPIDKKHISPEENAKRKRNFEYQMKMNRYQYFPLKGKYGKEEESYLILNIGLEDLKHLANEFHQESFIFAEKVFPIDSSYEPFMFYEFYSIVGYKYKWGKDKIYDYKGIGIGEEIKNAKDLQDFFSKIKNYKFQIDFLFFEKALMYTFISLWEKYRGSSYDILLEKIKFVSKEMRETDPKRRWLRRAFIMENIVEQRKRVAKLLQYARNKKEKKSSLRQLDERYMLEYAKNLDPMDD